MRRGVARFRARGGCCARASRRAPAIGFERLHGGPAGKIDTGRYQESRMRSSMRLCVAAVAGVLLVSGCALRDPRDSYSYGRVSDGLWDADYDLLLDWNFPTSANLGPIEAPQRFKPDRPAIGVPWATGNPLPPPDAGQAPAHEGSAEAQPVPAAHDGEAASGTDSRQASPPGDDAGGVRNTRVGSAVTRR